MIRKYFISLLLSLVTLIASAQISVGQWKIHPYFVGDIITNCVDTKDKVYYLSSGSLFCYDKIADTNTALNAMGEINDIGVNQIYYSIEKDQLYVVYKDCNLDIIKSNGAVYNISAIKDVVLNMSQAKVVNDITFSNGKAYVATSFGFIVIDEEHENAYKSEQVPRYHARETAIARASLCGVGRRDWNFPGLRVRSQADWRHFRVPWRRHSRDAAWRAVARDS